jgi:hypothetical protein
MSSRASANAKQRAFDLFEARDGDAPSGVNFFFGSLGDYV